VRCYVIHLAHDVAFDGSPFREIRNLVMAEMAMVMAIMRVAIMLRKMMIMRMRRRVGVINRVI
jgi:hypothetical protein